MSANHTVIYSRPAVGDVFLEGAQGDLALHTLGLRLSAEVDVHHVTSQSLQTGKTSHALSDSVCVHVMLYSDSGPASSPCLSAGRAGL